VLPPQYGTVENKNNLLGNLSLLVGGSQDSRIMVLYSVNRYSMSIIAVARSDPLTDLWLSDMIMARSLKKQSLASPRVPFSVALINFPFQAMCSYARRPRACIGVAVRCPVPEASLF
jgi:hypothetical protein